MLTFHNYTSIRSAHSARVEFQCEKVAVVGDDHFQVESVVVEGCVDRIQFVKILEAIYGPIENGCNCATASAPSPKKCKHNRFCRKHHNFLDSLRKSNATEKKAIRENECDNVIRSAAADRDFRHFACALHLHSKCSRNTDGNAKSTVKPNTASGNGCWQPALFMRRLDRSKTRNAIVQLCMPQQQQRWHTGGASERADRLK